MHRGWGHDQILSLVDNTRRLSPSARRLLSLHENVFWVFCNFYLRAICFSRGASESYLLICWAVVARTARHQGCMVAKLKTFVRFLGLISATNIVWWSFVVAMLSETSPFCFHRTPTSLRAWLKGFLTHLLNRDGHLIANHSCCGCADRAASFGGLWFYFLHGDGRARVSCTLILGARLDTSPRCFGIRALGFFARHCRHLRGVLFMRGFVTRLSGLTIVNFVGKVLIDSGIVVVARSNFSGIPCVGGCSGSWSDPGFEFDILGGGHHWVGRGLLFGGSWHKVRLQQKDFGPIQTTALCKMGRDTRAVTFLLSGHHVEFDPRFIGLMGRRLNCFSEGCRAWRWVYLLHNLGLGASLYSRLASTLSTWAFVFGWNLVSLLNSGRKLGLHLGFCLYRLVWLLTLGGFSTCREEGATRQVGRIWFQISRNLNGLNFDGGILLLHCKLYFLFFVRAFPSLCNIQWVIVLGRFGLKVLLKNLAPGPLRHLVLSWLNGERNWRNSFTLLMEYGLSGVD